MQSLDSIEIYACGMSKDLVREKEEIEFSNIINFGDGIKEIIKEHNPNWPQINYHPYRILIIGGSGS